MTNTFARVERVLWIACPVLLFMVMFGHTTAVVFNALALLALGTLAAAFSPQRPPVWQWPLVVPIACWAAWSLAAVAWSAYPAVSMHAWCDEVLYPLVSFWGFWLLGTRTQRLGSLTLISWIACMGLAVISALNWGHLQPPTANTFQLHYYNRVGHTSTLAVFAMALFCAVLSRPRWRVVGVTGLGLCLFVGFGTLNRFFWPAAAVTLLVALFPFYRRHILLALLAFAVVGAAALGTLEYSARLRLNDAPMATVSRDVAIDGREVQVPQAFASIGDTLSSDTRPKLWAFYAEQGKRHMWLGVGFGKPLPGMAYQSDIPQSLLQIEPQALTHAHNLFLDTWLQTGIIGVALQTLLLLGLVGSFRRAGRGDQWLCAAGIALVAGMIVKNATDDFMWQTTMLAFWSFAGLLLGSGQQVGVSGATRSAGASRAGLSNPTRR
jgi:O-antigen ligase